MKNSQNKLFGDITATEVSNVNKQLTQVRSMAQESISGLNQSAQLLVDNQQKVDNASGIYKQLRGNVKKSTMYLKKIAKTHKWNVYMVYISFTFFLLVCVFIIFRRLLYKGFYKAVCQMIINFYWSLFSSVEKQEQPL